MIPIDWTLDHLSITQDWNKKGYYKGNVKFKNGVQMEVAFLLDHEKCARMMSIIQDEVVESAKTIGDLLIKSMPVQLSQGNGPAVPEIEAV